MKKATLSLLCLLACFATGFAQSWETVKNSPAYLWGEGWGVSVAEADKQALNDLISKISVQVSASTTQRERETVTSAGIESDADFSSVVSTYSNATLTNTEKIIIENEPDAHVGRWIKRSDIEKIFESRKNKISDFVSSAVKAERQGKIDVALKDLYWALSLTRTLQDPNEFRVEDEDGNRVAAMSWIPHFLNEIFDNLDVRVTKRDSDQLELLVTYKGIPVNSADYTYFDGRDWSNIYSARDGVGVLELAPGNTSSTLQLKFEYEYLGESHIDNEMKAVLEAISGLPMRKAYKNVKSEPVGAAAAPALAAPAGTIPAMAPAAPSTNSFATVEPEIFQMPASPEDVDRYAAVLVNLSKAIAAKRYDDNAALFTPQAREIYDRLIKYGQGRIVGNSDFTFYKYGDNTIARGLTMSFSFKSGMRKSFVEEVVFSFDPEGKINNISFGLGKTAEADILGRGVWPEHARMTIMNFLENYQTAYALKRLDYIESIFDDDAVIITGTVSRAPARKVKRGDMTGIDFGHEIIRYNRYSKDTYLQHLKKSFASKEYINLRLADNEVRKLGKGGEVYAIQISQEYYSSNYGDKGYLFLMVDINDPENPVIKIRTWQPEKDPDFGIYGPEHFK